VLAFKRQCASSQCKCDAILITADYCAPSAPTTALPPGRTYLACSAGTKLPAEESSTPLAAAAAGKGDSARDAARAAAEDPLGLGRATPSTAESSMAPVRAAMTTTAALPLDIAGGAAYDASGDASRRRLLLPAADAAVTAGPPYAWAAACPTAAAVCVISEWLVADVTAGDA